MVKKYRSPLIVGYFCNHKFGLSTQIQKELSSDSGCTKSIKFLSVYIERLSSRRSKMCNPTNKKQAWTINRCSDTKWSLLIACLIIGVLVSTGSVRCQRDGSDDDFDDPGFDDSGYSSPQSHDAEGSHHNPSNYSPSSEEDLDDDDDVDESHVSPQVATEEPVEAVEGSVNHQDQAMGSPFASVGGPQQFYNSPDSMILTNVRPASSGPQSQQHEVADQGPFLGTTFNGHQLRYRRSIGTDSEVEPELDIEDVDAPGDSGSKHQLSRAKRSLVRKKRYSHKYIGPVYTYVKTDKHARFKWGVKHKVGKKHHG